MANLGKKLVLGLLKLMSLSVKQAPIKKCRGNLVFILTTGRTGTKFLAEYFNQYSGVQATHEPGLTRALRFWWIARLDGLVNDEKMKQILLKYRGDLFEKQGTYIDTTPFIIGFAPVLSQIFDNVKMVHIVRDPRDYVQSSLNHGTFSGLKGFANKFLPLSYPDLGSVTRKNPATDLEKVSAFWVLLNRFILETVEDNPNYHRLRFEDLFMKDGSGLEKFGKIIGVETEESKALQKTKKVNRSQLNIMPNWKHWDSNQAQKLNDICQPLMSKLGYGQETEWQKLLNGPEK